MAEIKIVGSDEAGASFPPQSYENDAAIFNAAAELLRKRGCVVNIYNEEQFREQDITEQIVLNICREQSSIAEAAIIGG